MSNMDLDTDDDGLPVVYVCEAKVYVDPKDIGTRRERHVWKPYGIVTDEGDARLWVDGRETRRYRERTLNVVSEARAEVV